MALPLQQTNILDLSLMQKSWAAQINPVLANPTTNPGLIIGVVLVSGTNIINHKLGKKMQGWIITDINAAITVYRPDSAPFNSLTLTLVASAPATVNIEVF